MFEYMEVVTSLHHFKPFYMKHQIMAGLSAALLLMACSSRKVTTTSTSMNPNGTTTTTTTSTHAAYNVPASIQSNFTTQYPGATDVVWAPYDVNTVPIDWDLTDWTTLGPKDYSVAYTLNGKRYYSWYDANGDWIGSSYEMTDYNNGLPAAVNTTISNKYAGYTIDKAHQIMWKDRTAYDLKLKNGDNKMKVLIDSDGNVLKEKAK
jgi:Putative beta-lactamase-inhibitor-like, PepSY-like